MRYCGQLHGSCNHCLARRTPAAVYRNTEECCISGVSVAPIDFGLGKDMSNAHFMTFVIAAQKTSVELAGSANVTQDT